MGYLKLINRIVDLQEHNDKLSFDVLKMRLDFEIVADNPDSPAAKKILAYYRRKKAIRDEAEQAAQN